MIISDLNHVEVVSEETETRIVGGGFYLFTSYTLPNSGGKGPVIFTSAVARTVTPPGSRGSSSTSSSSIVSFWQQ